ncbi:MAG TPA: hypothetical protein VN193_02980 [Candidatus Angelobacter sp.]|nr:hypothetical protein [Candidatus Angelobacter sp.]
MSLNRAILIGAVVRPPRSGPSVDDSTSCALLVRTVRDGGHAMDRHHVLATDHLEQVAAALKTGDTVFVEGRLQRLGDRRSFVVLARQLWIVDNAPPPPLPQAPPTRAHASPKPHPRAPHDRRIHVGTPQERLIRVKATRVNDPTRNLKRPHR